MKQLTAPVMMIQCAAEDLGYLKTLLVEVYTQQQIKTGKFVSQGMVQIFGEEAYKQHIMEPKCTH